MSRPVDPRLFRTVPAGRRLVRALVVVQVVGGILVVARAVLLADVVVRLFTGSTDVFARLVLLAAVGVAQAASAGVQERITARASVRVRAQLRRATLDAIVRLGPAWAKRQPPGELVNATGPGLDVLDGYVTRALPALVSAGVVPALALGAIVVTDWASGIILLVLLPLVPVFMILIGITTNRLVQRQYTALGRLAGQFLDLLRGLTTLRVYGQARAQEQTLRRATDDYRRQTVATLRIAFLSGLVLDLVAALSVAVVAVEIGLRLAGDHVSFATALLVLLLAPEVFAPLRAVGAQHHANQEGAVAAGAALDIIDAAQDVATPGRPAPPVCATGRISLDDVCVTYPGRVDRALAEVSLDLAPGRIVALTGPSGAGKSTVLAALLGYVSTSGGRIVVGTADGAVPLSSIDADRWRTNLAWLPQRPRPSRASVADEVRLGHPDATDVDVAAVCRICHTPAPDTLLGEDGRAVSAGQRRRIALARALLRAQSVRTAGGTPIVLLDEPSEDLDESTERVVAAVIESLANWATVVVATHSVALVALADVRVRIVAGQVVELATQVPVRAGAVPVRTAVRVEKRARPAALPAAVPFRLRELVREAGATRRLLLAAVFSAAAALTAFGLTATSMWLISRAAQHPNVQALAIAVVGVRTFAIGRALLKYAERLVTHDGALLMLAALRVRVFAALRPLSPAALGGYGRGDLLRRFVGDVDGAQEGLVRALVPSSGAVAGALGAVVLATVLVPGAGLALGVGLAAAGVAVPLAGFRCAGNSRTVVELSGRRDRSSAGLLDALDEVVAYGGAHTAVDEIARTDDTVQDEVGRPALATALSVFAAGAVAAITLAVVLAVAAAAVTSGSLSVVNVGVLAVCVLTGFDAVSTLPAAYVAWARCRAGLDRVAEVMSLRPEFVEPEAAPPMPDGALGLRASMIDLAPASDAPLLLHGATLSLPPGVRVAVVGASGCGKSTLLAAALRLVPVTRGSYAITGTDSAVELAELREQDVPAAVAGSLQGDHVFDATLRDNLRVVRPTASDAELDLIAARVGLSGFTDGLPDGWSTPAGPDGSALSGGQRQRLLVARALLADPQILVLDEPTAHLDAATERLVIADLLSATCERTVLLTTHRRLEPGRVDATVRMRDGVLIPDVDRVPAAG